MARNKSGGGVDDYLADASGVRLAGEKVGFYRDAACTQRITDLLDGNGTPVTELTTDTDGYWGIVQFPDDGTTYAYAARLHPSNGAPITPGRIVDAHTAFLNLSGEKGAANGLATLDGSGDVVQPVPYANVTGVPDLTVYPLKTETPSIEEIASDYLLIWVGQSTGDLVRDDADTTKRASASVISRPYDWTVLSVDLNITANIAASDTNYWTFTVERYDPVAATSATIATKTTEATGGEAITLQKPWRFTTGAMDPGARLIGPDEVLRITTQPTGAPGDLTRVAASVRYARQ